MKFLAFRSLVLSSFFLLYALPVAVAEKPLKVFYDAPSFSLTDSHGKEFSTDSLKGSVWVASFFFSTCKGPCPITMANLSKLVRELKEQKNLSFVSISVDPETDTPEVLREFAEPLRGADTRWRFLTGEKEKIYSMLRSGFKVGAGPSPDFHSTSFVLVDKAGKVRGYYSGMREEDLTKLKKDLQELDAKPAA